ncbi:MAG: mechanosensitive ion channel [Tatlockia sp.]|nr:mechanosensitive ion channel [Tatlockia sp.]
MNSKSTLLNQNKTILTGSTKAGFIPLFFMLTFSIFHLFFINYGFYFTTIFSNPIKINLIEYYCYWCVMTLGSYWLISRIINTLKLALSNSSIFLNHSRFAIFIPFFSRMLKALSFLSLFNLLVQQLNLPGDSSHIFNKVTSILIIICISSLVFKLVDISEKLLNQHYEDLSGTIDGRKIVTKTLILKRVAYSVLIAITIGAILTLFDNVRALGASVLTTAGLLGLIATFTAQRSLGSIFSGLEIALTQPIKIGDVVVIDNEQGVIEEINFRSVVIKLWDWRRLIVPTNYFLEKSFENWSSKQNSNLIAKVTLYVDFTLPVSKVRHQLNVVLNSSSFWDKDVGKLNVSDLKEQVMEIKILASARNASEANELKNEIREKIIDFIAKNYPQCLPTTRNYTVKTMAFDNLSFNNLENLERETI